MSCTRIPDSRSSRAVPPVETSSTPSRSRLWAKSTRPVLSVTLRMARWIFGTNILFRLGNRLRNHYRELKYRRKDLAFGLRLQLHLAVFQFHGVLHGAASIFFADLLSLLLQKRLERLHAGIAAAFARLDLGLHHGFEQVLHPVGLFINVGEKSGADGGVGIESPFGAVLLGGANSLDTKNGVLWPAIAFFPDLQLLPPKVAHDGVLLGDAVVLEALGVVQL